MKTVVTMIIAIMMMMIVIMMTMIVIMVTMKVIMVDKMMKKIIICCSPGGSSP